MSHKTPNARRLTPDDLPHSPDYLAWKEEMKEAPKRIPYHDWIAQQLNLPKWGQDVSSV